MMWKIYIVIQNYFFHTIWILSTSILIDCARLVILFQETSFFSRNPLEKRKLSESFFIFNLFILFEKRIIFFSNEEFENNKIILMAFTFEGERDSSMRCWKQDRIINHFQVSAREKMESLSIKSSLNWLNFFCWVEESCLKLSPLVTVMDSKSKAFKCFERICVNSSKLSAEEIEELL